MQRTCELHAFPAPPAPRTPPPPPPRTQVVCRAINDYSRVTLIAAQMEGMKFAGLARSGTTAEPSPPIKAATSFQALRRRSFLKLLYS